MHLTRGAARAGGPERLAGLDLVVSTERDASGELLIRELQRTRARVHHVWPVPPLLPREADVIFCDLLPDLPDRLPWVPGEPAAALVVLTLPAVPLDLDLLRKSVPEAALHRPFTPVAILASLALARGRFEYEQRLRGRIERLDGTLRVIRSVERAKAVLMHHRQLQENEAYEYLRSQAMERRVSIGAMAAMVVDAYKVIV